MAPQRRANERLMGMVNPFYDGLTTMTHYEVPNSIEGTSFGDAYEAGAKAGTEIGPFVRWWPDLQMTNVLKMTGFEEHTDVPGVRLRRHGLITADTGWFKSSSTKFYLEHGIGCRPVKDVIHEDGVPQSPTMFKASGLSSYEALVGSASSDGQLLRPLFAATDYVFSSELMTFLGADSNQQQETVDNLCRLLEEGNITRRLVKFRNVDLTDSDEQWLENNGVEFSQADGVMEYDAHCSLIGCTRPLDEDVEEVLEDSGLRSRFYHSPWPGEDEGVQAIKDMGGPRYNIEDMMKIRDFNRKMFLVEFSEMPHPPQGMFHEVFDVYEQCVEELVEDAGLKASHVFDGRDFMTIKQFLTGAAVERIVRKIPDDGAMGTTIHEIQYLDEDAQIAKYFAKQYGITKFDILSKDIRVTKMEQQDLHNLTSLHQAWDSDEPMPTDWLVENSVGTLITLHGRPMQSRKSFYNLLNRCMDRGWVTRVEHGKYIVTERGKTMIEEVKKSNIDAATKFDDRGGTRAL